VVLKKHPKPKTGWPLNPNPESEVKYRCRYSSIVYCTCIPVEVKDAIEETSVYKRVFPDLGKGTEPDVMN
jgi:hypothetical protein